MQRREPRDYTGQIHKVQTLEVLRPGYIMTLFTVEEWPNHSVCVTKCYRPETTKWLEYAECYRVGPRGAVSVVYKSYRKTSPQT